MRLMSLLKPIAQVPLLTARFVREELLPELAGLALLCIGYSVVFSITLGEPFVPTFYYAVTNTLAFLFVAVLMLDLMKRTRLRTRPVFIQAGVHVILAMSFAFLWYLAILAGYAVGDNWMREGLAVRAFGMNAMVWQLFQGIALYGVVALFGYLRDAQREIVRLRTAVSEEGVEYRRELGDNHLLLRDGKEMVSISLDEIVRISGSGDYSDVATASRNYLSATTLAAFEAKLPNRFARVHRSHIVRIGAIVRAEPAGNGRISLHLANGEALVTSRDGGRLIRNAAA